MTFENNSTRAASDIPEWSTTSASEKKPRSLQPYIARQWITLDEAAEILSAHNEGETSDWWSTLDDAAGPGGLAPIEASDWRTDQGEQPLRHQDIRRWCKTYGYVWPVPEPSERQPEAPASDSELLADLHQAQARIATLENERAELQRELAAIKTAEDADKINSPTLAIILELVRAYPAWRAQQSRDPLRKEIKDWLRVELQERHAGGIARIIEVSDVVIAEHYRLKP